MRRFPGHRSRYDLTYNYAGGNSDGRPCVRIGHAALPCPGVALRFSTVIDCSPGEGRMPPVTIDFVNKNLPAAVGGLAGPPAARPAGRFTCDSGDLALSGQLQWVEEMVAAAGLPPEWAPSVGKFLRLSASSASDTFFKAVAVTVETVAPGSFAMEDYEDEPVPPGADSGECPICYLVYVVGGDTSVELPCGHTFHRKCLKYWTSMSMNPTCPYCRATVPGAEDHHYWDEEGEPEHDVSGSQPSSNSTWSRICRSRSVLCILIYVLAFL